ncbi:MAG: hypothetical protein ACLT33_10710 [Lachnospira pectinoschiza]
MKKKKKFVQKLYRKLESGKKLADEMQYLRKNDLRLMPRRQRFRY